MTDTFESQHPRQAAGKFATKENTSPDSGLLRPPFTGGLQREQWIGDNAYPLGDPEQFDLNAVLDTMSVEQLREVDLSDADELYFTAVRLDLLEDGAGPFSLDIDELAFEDYVTARETAGQDAPIAAAPAFSKKEIREKTTAALHEAAQQFPTFMLDGSKHTTVSEVQTRADKVLAVFSKFKSDTGLEIEEPTAHAIRMFQRAADEGEMLNVLRGMSLLAWDMAH